MMGKPMLLFGTSGVAFVIFLFIYQLENSRERRGTMHVRSMFVMSFHSDTCEFVESPFEMTGSWSGCKVNRTGSDLLNTPSL